jgi:hypothetical protein
MNPGDVSAWFNVSQMDGGQYMACVVPDGVDFRPDLTQAKLITRTILAGGTNASPQSDTTYTDTAHPFELSQESLMRSGVTVIGMNMPTNQWKVGSSVTCAWTVVTYQPVYSKLILANLAQQTNLLTVTGSLTSASASSWHVGSTYATEYTFQGVVVVPNNVGTQQVYFLNCQQGVANSSWMAGNITAGVAVRPLFYNGMYGRFIERTIVP